MKHAILLFTVLLLISPLTWAGPAQYSNVSGWQNCIKTIDKQFYKYTCIPPTKPEGCSDAAWNTLNKGQMLPFCPLCPPPPAAK